MLMKCQKKKSSIYFAKAKLNPDFRAWLSELQVTYCSSESKNHIHELNTSYSWKRYLEMFDYILISPLKYLHPVTKKKKSHFLENQFEVWSVVCC